MSKHFSFGLESTLGTAVAPTKGLPIRAGEGMKTLVDLRGQEVFDGSLSAYSDYYQGLVTHEGEIETDLDSQAAGYFWRSLCGTVTTTAVTGETGIYEHQFLPTGNKASFTIEQYNDTFPVRYAGVLVNSAKITAEPGGSILATYGLLGRSVVEDVNSAATVTYNLGHTFTHADVAAGLKVDNTSLPLVSNFEVEIISNKQAQYGLGNVNPQGFASGRYEVKGKFVLYLNDSNQISFYEAYLDKAAKALEITFNGDSLSGTNVNKESLKLSLPKAYFSALLNPINAEAARLEVEFVATLDASTQTLFELTLINQISSYAS
ncbi:MAG: phage tail tube protein [bacterium]|nr:phage tail tube protein [bacterium]